MVPEEFQGSFEWEGPPDAALEALKNFLFGVYGKDKFKIVTFNLADGERDNLIPIPPEVQNSQEVH